MSVPLSFGAAEGRTKDLSSRGVYFVTPLDPKVGSVVALSVTLPPSSPMGDLALELRARVVRLDDYGDRRGVAAEIETWGIPDLGEG
jgi:hypothetical protein